MASTSSTSTVASTLKGYNTTLTDLLKDVNRTRKGGYSVFNRSLFSGAGDTTKDAWEMAKDAATVPWYKKGLDASAGYHGGLMKNGGMTDGQLAATTGMRDVASGYDDIVDMGGLTPEQRAAMGGMTTVGNRFGNIADRGGFAPGQRGAMGVVGDVGDGYADIAQDGGSTAGQRNAMSELDHLLAEYGGVSQRGGLTSGMRGDISTTRDATASYKGMFDQAGNPSLTEDTLLGIARGDSLNYNDPVYKRMIDRVANETSADVNAAMGADGAYGSNVHVGALVDQVGGLRDAAAVREREFELGRQRDALAAIEGRRDAAASKQLASLSGILGGSAQGFGMRQTGEDNVDRALKGTQGAAESRFGMDQATLQNLMAALSGRKGAAETEYGMAGSALDRKMGALTSQAGADAAAFDMAGTGLDRTMAGLAGRAGAESATYGMEQGGINNMDAATKQLQELFAAGQLPASIYGNVGAAEDADAQGELLGKYDLHGRKNSARTDFLAELAGLAATLGGAGGTKTKTKVPETPWWQSVLSAVGQFV